MQLDIHNRDGLRRWGWNLCQLWKVYAEIHSKCAREYNGGGRQLNWRTTKFESMRPKTIIHKNIKINLYAGGVGRRQFNLWTANSNTGHFNYSSNIMLMFKVIDAQIEKWHFRALVTVWNLDPVKLNFLGESFAICQWKKHFWTVKIVTNTIHAKMELTSVKAESLSKAFYGAVFGNGETSPE